MLASYQNYWSQRPQQQQLMMAPYFYYPKSQNMYYPNYSQAQSSQYMNSMSPSVSISTSRMSSMNQMNTMAHMGAMNPMGGMNSMGAMSPMGGMNSMGITNRMGAAMSPMGVMNPMGTMSPMSPVAQQYYGMYPPPVYNNFQKYENYTLQNNNLNKHESITNDTKVIKNEPIKMYKKSPMPREEKKTKVKQSWWKVNVNKNREETDFTNGSSNETQLTSNTVVTRNADSFSISQKKRYMNTPINRARRKSTPSASNISTKASRKPLRNPSVTSTKSISNKKRKSNLIILKKEVSFITEPQESQDIFHLISGARVKDGYESVGVTQKLGYYDYNDIQYRMSATKLGQQQIANLLCNNKAKKKENDETKEKVNTHCKEILSKFAISETSSDYIEKNISSTNVDNYTDLGKNLNNTMFFIMNEMHSINASSTNYLSLKLTPRQKQSIALLIIDEVNALRVPQQFWGHVCRLVIHMLNENFRLYFEKIKDQPEIKESEKNNWLWMVDLANNAQ